MGLPDIYAMYTDNDTPEERRAKRQVNNAREHVHELERTAHTAERHLDQVRKSTAAYFGNSSTL